MSMRDVVQPEIPLTARAIIFRRSACRHWRRFWNRRHARQALYVEMKFEAGVDYQSLAAAVVREIREHNLVERAMSRALCSTPSRRSSNRARHPHRRALERKLKRPFLSSRRISSAQSRRAPTRLPCTVRLPGARWSRSTVRGLGALVWTADNPVWAKRARSYGSRRHTNRPALLRAALAHESHEIRLPRHREDFTRSTQFTVHYRAGGARVGQTKHA